MKFRLSKNDAETIKMAVSAAEAKTSAEIKVIVHRYSWDDIRDAARRLFYRHGLQNTPDRNAVLIFVVLTNQQFLIFGDKGISQLVGDGFWTSIRDEIGAKIAANGLPKAIIQGVHRIGDSLAKHFPIEQKPRNYLDDQVLRDD
jgi:uncharacterized membrane protein